MKAKYIFRGFGLGVIITAVIMSAYTRSTVADARVNVLKEYGIGEEATLAETLVDIDGNDDNDAQENRDEDGLEVIPFDEVPEAGENKPDEETASQSDTVLDGVANSEVIIQGNIVDDESAQEPAGVIVIEPSDDTEGNGSDNTITIVISQGDDSGTVARKLHSAGIVDNAAEFDAFLIQHGYDKKMRAGTKVINIDASWQEIADKISR